MATLQRLQNIWKQYRLKAVLQRIQTTYEINCYVKTRNEHYWQPGKVGMETIALLHISHKIKSVFSSLFGAKSNTNTFYVTLWDIMQCYAMLCNIM